jgi:hypothetical protein
MTEAAEWAEIEQRHRALLHKVCKFDTAQARDQHGRWTADGGDSAGTVAQFNDVPSFRAATGRTVSHALAAAAALANSLAAVSAVSSAPGLLHALAHLHALRLHMQDLSNHLRGTREGLHELSAATRVKLQTLADHLHNVRDHLARIRHQAAGSLDRADHYRRRVALRTRAMALRAAASEPAPRERASGWDTATTIVDAAARGFAS